MVSIDRRSRVDGGWFFTLPVQGRNIRVLFGGRPGVEARRVLRVRDLLAPPVCLACRAPGFDLCPACRRSIPWLEEPGCRRCGLPGCDGRRCPAARQAFARAWAPVAYAGPVPALVRGLKQRRTRAAAEPMVAAMARAPAWLLADGRKEVSLVPVPTAAARARARGFDQAALLAAGLATRGLGPLTPILERVGAGSRQRGSSRAERLTAGRIELRVRPGVPVPEHCILIDDVHTTGATFDAAASALLRAGARRVTALAYARALP